MMVIKRQGSVSSTRRFHQLEKTPTMADEISLSHYLRVEDSLGPGIGSYGAKLAEYILSQGLIPEDAAKAVEVGGGLGDVAVHCVTAFSKRCRELSWIGLDMSPKLLEAQKTRLQPFGETVDFKFIQGDGEKIASQVYDVDFLLSNEVVGDYRAVTNVPLSEKGGPSGRLGRQPNKADQMAWKVAWQMINRYGIGLPSPSALDEDGFVLNYGMIKFVEGLSKCLKPGGSAFVIEHSSEPSRRVQVANHVEYSMSPEQFEKAVAGNGLEMGKMGKANDFLHIPGGLQVVQGPKVNSFQFYAQQPEFKDLPLMEITRELRGSPNLSRDIGDRWKRWVSENDVFDMFMTRQEALRRGHITASMVQQIPGLTRPLDEILDQFRYYIVKKPG